MEQNAAPFGHNTSRAITRMAKRRPGDRPAVAGDAAAYTAERVHIKTGDARPAYYFRLGASMIRINIDGRRLCDKCGGVCRVVKSPIHESHDGTPRRVQSVKCSQCQAITKVSYSPNVPYSMLTPDAEDHPMAELLSDIAAIADALPSLAPNKQQDVIRALTEAINSVVVRDK